MNSIAVSVDQVQIDVSTVERAVASGHDLVVLPLRENDGVAVYSESSVMLVKTLKANGLDAAFLDLSDARTFEVKKSAIATAVVTWILGIASSASWEALKAAIRKQPSQKLSVTYVDLKSDTGLSGQAWKVEGDTEGVLAAIDKLRSNGDE